MQAFCAHAKQFNIRWKEQLDLGKPKLIALGKRLIQKHLEVDPDKIETICRWPQIRDANQLRSFLAQFPFIVDHVSHLQEITALLRVLVSKKAKWEWNENCNKAVATLKNIVARLPARNALDLSKHLIVHIDASDHAVGYALTQVSDPTDLTVTEENLLSMYSCALNSAQKNYPIIVKEAFAGVVALRKLHDIIAGRLITLVTDNNALFWLVNQSVATPQRSLQLWLYTYSEYNVRAVWVNTTQNYVPDSLTRLHERYPSVWGVSPGITTRRPTASVQTSIKDSAFIATSGAAALHELLREDIDMWPADTSITYGFTDHPLWSDYIPPNQLIQTNSITTNSPIFCNLTTISNSDNRWVGDVAPTALLASARSCAAALSASPTSDNETSRDWLHRLKQFHELANHCDAHHIAVHFGGERQLPLPKNLYALARQVTDSCHQCLTNNPAKRYITRMRPILSFSPLVCFHMDFKTDLPVTSRGNCVLLALKDPMSRFAILRPQKSKEAAETTTNLRLIFGIIGYPKILRSDNEAVWKSNELQLFMIKYGIKHEFTDPYVHHQNSVERLIGIVSPAIRKHSHDRGVEWDECTDDVQSAYNSLIGSTTGWSPFSVAFGRHSTFFDHTFAKDTEYARLPPDRAMELWEQHVKELIDVFMNRLSSEQRERQKLAIDKLNRKNRNLLQSQDLATNQIVYVRDQTREGKNSPLYYGPYAVASKTPSGAYLLRDEKGAQLETPFHRSLLKAPAFYSSTISKDTLNGTVPAYLDYIVAHKKEGTTGEFLYKIRWVGMGEHGDEWVPSAIIEKSAINEYWGQFKKRLPKTRKKNRCVLGDLSVKSKITSPSSSPTKIIAQSKQMASEFSNDDGKLVSEQPSTEEKLPLLAALTRRRPVGYLGKMKPLFSNKRPRNSNRILKSPIISAVGTVSSSETKVRGDVNSSVSLPSLQ